jgi:hypothetical protein
MTNPESIQGKKSLEKGGKVLDEEEIEEDPNSFTKNPHRSGVNYSGSSEESILKV